jgi:hypothetical protein
LARAKQKLSFYRALHAFSLFKKVCLFGAFFAGESYQKNIFSKY